MLDIKQLKNDLYYDKASGLFFWKVARGSVKVGDLAGTWKKDGYVAIKYRQKLYAPGRLAWFYETGAWPPPGFIIEHRNGNGFDNRWKSLTLTNRSENRAKAWVRQNYCT